VRGHYFPLDEGFELAFAYRKGGEIDQTLRNIYARRHVVAACCLCTMISWISVAGEVWIGFQALGIPAGFEKAIILESVG